MPPQKHSRYSYCLGIKRRGRLWLSSMTPFRYKELPDTIVHETTDGETLDQIAERYYGDDGWKFWWAIGQFQPLPIVDPTLSFGPNEIVYVPSRQTLFQKILDPSRRREF